MQEKLNKYYFKYHYLFPLVIAFVMPFDIPYAPIIAIWLITFFLFENIKNKIINVVSNKWLWLLWIFFMIHFLGCLFSLNKKEAVWNLEIRLVFFILPFLILNTDYKYSEIKKIFIAFIFSSVLITIACFNNAFHQLYYMNDYSFYYSKFTHYMHPSYYSMYLIFSILLLLFLSYSYFRRFTYKIHIFIFSIIAFLLVGIFLAASKMGFISTIIILPIVITIYLLKLGYKKMVILLWLFFLITSIVIVLLEPLPIERLKIAYNAINKPIDIKSCESTEIRILIWQQAIEIIKENSIFGVTPGDVNDFLLLKYKQNGIIFALNHKLSTHNQFLHTYLGTGIIGFCILLCLTLGVAIFAFVKKYYLLFLFSLLIILNFMVESMLEQQAGFTFFVFFLSFLILFSKKNNYQL